ncbi:Protein CBG00249 [Caenorhabditis briggsae]|uniref:Protein CBG00249 n=2 Tax=Caenorhabditis briggsae TaxID=6238 RepID=A8WMJ8_CAEBR|nr:Protein CBG00249 [Caenorhabditis briggsae]ULT83687.1 hypothetical protein L3Y34_012737 [Caenorhabditis briggsae]CAP21703.1 Protein CBG00249 [Caenorhabditis briggsae]
MVPTSSWLPILLRRKLLNCRVPLFRSYYIPTVTDLTMDQAKEEPLTSFAENPTKSVEKDALVEQGVKFTRPDQVKKANVAEAKWPWCKGKDYGKMPRYLIVLLLAFLLIAVVVMFYVFLHVGMRNTPTTVVHEPEIVYTLPSERIGDEDLHHVVTLPVDKEIASEEDLITTTTDGSVSEITDDVVEEAEKSEDVEKKEVEAAEELQAETATLETTKPVSTTPARRRRPTPTRRMPISTSTLQFYDPVDDETTESCFDRLITGSPSGVYNIQGPKDYQAYCDMDTTTGGWTVIQRRVDGEEIFQRGTMKKYVNGFGKLNGSHWLGLEKMHYMAPVGSLPATLRIEIQGETCDTTCSRRFANNWVGEWKVNFGGKEDGYKIYFSGRGIGNLTVNGSDPFYEANGKRFTTLDNDQDENTQMNCAGFRMLGAWWHTGECSSVGLNGYYQTVAQKYNINDRNQNDKRYFVWAHDKHTIHGYPYIIHVRKSLMLLKPDVETHK